MDCDTLWQKFTETGCVEDYLTYCASKGENEEWKSLRELS